MSGLLARTTRLDDDLDPVTVGGTTGLLWSRGQFGLAGLGEATRITVDRANGDAAAVVAQTELAAIDVEDEVGAPGCGAVAFAAFPFRPELPGEMIVPEIVVGRDADGRRWITVVAEKGSHCTDPAARIRYEMAGSPRMAEPTRYEVTTPLDPLDWRDRVAVVRDRIVAGDLTKVVLAREAVLRTDVPLDPATVLARLATTFPTAILFRVGGFCGASPELLVSRHADVVRSHPLAGTAPRSADPAADAQLASLLLASTKDRWEHQITIDAVLDLLLPFCSYVDAEPEPSLVRMANVQHLGTLVEGRLSTPAASVLQLVATLHPTPAVGGEPRADALRLISEIEGYDRARYAGPTGWVDGTGNGGFAVAIRSAQLDGLETRWSAGAGVVADSDPDEELAETRSKFSALLGALLRP